MENKALFYKMPFAIIPLTLLANAIGILSAAQFNSIYFDVSGFKINFSYSFVSIYNGLSMELITSISGLPFGLILVILYSFICQAFIRSHLLLSSLLGLFLGFSFMAVDYWAVGMFCYIFFTAVSSVGLIMLRQKHLTKHSTWTELTP